MKKQELLEFLAKEVGFPKEAFKDFGGGFKTYEDFNEFQITTLNNLKKYELQHLYNYIQSIKILKPRHIDFVNPFEHYVVAGVYYNKHGKVSTYSPCQ